MDWINIISVLKAFIPDLWKGEGGGGEKTTN